MASLAKVMVRNLIFMRLSSLRGKQSFMANGYSTMALSIYIDFETHHMEIHISSILCHCFLGRGLFFIRVVRTGENPSWAIIPLEIHGGPLRWPVRAHLGEGGL